MVGTQITETHATEVFYLVARFEGIDDTPTDASLREADRDIRALERQGLELEAADWRLAAEVKADGSVSLADAYAVALAHECEATLIAGADDDFGELPVDIDLLRFRKEGV
jgi:predicted nucleic acid-binding protein